MIDRTTLQHDALSQINACETLEALDAVRVAFLGKKGHITALMKELGTLDPKARAEQGSALNQLRDTIQTALNARQTLLSDRALNAQLAQETIDVTLPTRPQPQGRIHPISQTIEEVTAYFLSRGFAVEEGPHIENDFNNFSALNIPANHPAREEQDTFYLKGLLDHSPAILRTHTSSVEIRTMCTQKPPIRMISVGRVFRADYDITHTPMFHQIEGLVIDTTVHMGHLKKCLKDFLQTFFQIKDLPLRFRPSFFPFVEPGAEVDIGCSWKDGQLILGTGDDWLEILGCGMTHPNVLKNCGIDPTVYQGFAFGMGIERIAMLKYGIPDLRQFYESDVRWLTHYGFDPMDLPSPLFQKKKVSA